MTETTNASGVSGASSPPDPKAPCALCSLPVGSQPLALATAASMVFFCCEGCKGIYQMLHDIQDGAS